METGCIPFLSMFDNVGLRLNHNNTHPIQKTGELLISEGLARREDIDAALRIQQQESAAIPLRSLHTPPERDMPESDPLPSPGSAFDNRSMMPRPITEGFGAAAAKVADTPASSQGDPKSERTIGRILCDLDLVSPIDLDRVLRKYQKQLRLGEILLREGVIDAGQLEQALHEQQTHLQPLGHILVRKNRITLDQLYSALSSQYNIPYKRIERFRYPEHQKSELIQIIGKNYAEENLILPFSLEGTKLTLAVYLPEKMMSIHELRTVYAYLRMECVLIRPDVFQNLFKQLYGAPVAPVVTDPPETIPPAVSGEDSTPDRAAPVQSGHHRSEPEVSQIVNYLLKHAIDARATSIHIEQGVNGPTVRCRINGLLEAFKPPGFNDRLPDMVGAMMTHIKTMAGLDPTETRVPQQGTFNVRFGAKEGAQGLDVDVQVAVWSTGFGEDATLRFSDAAASDLHLDRLQHSFHSLNPLKKVLDDTDGIVLFSGPPGSGKQTSLCAVASYLLRPEIKIVAIGETVGYRHPGMVHIRVQKGLNPGADVLLRMAPHHDPDVILVTNLGDPQTARTVFDIAPTGPFILGATVAEDAVDTLFRLRAMGIETNRIAQSLKAILAQRRVRKICRVCKKKYLPDPEEWRPLFDTYPSHLSFYKGTGCPSCRFTGYDGSTVVSECLPIDHALMAALHKGANASEIRRLAVRSGFKEMSEDALLKLDHTTIQELLKNGFRQIKVPETPEIESDPGSKPAAPLEPMDDEEKNWSIGSLKKDAGAIDDMYETYRRLRVQTGDRPASTEAGLFHEFIGASFHHICRHYGCSRVRFCIERRRGQAEITASPVRTV